MSLALPSMDTQSTGTGPPTPSSTTSVVATRGSTPATSPGLTPTDPSNPAPRALSSLEATAPSTVSSSSSVLPLKAGRTTAAAHHAKKPPTLSDIAARMNLEGRCSPAPADSHTSSHLDIHGPLRGRLGLAGRLNSSSSSSDPHQSDTEADDPVVASSPRPVALGLPPTLADGKSSSSSGSPMRGSTSREQSPVSESQPPQAKPSSSSSSSSSSTSAGPSKAKGMPSLDEIRVRMAQKGHESPRKKKRPAQELRDDPVDRSKAAAAAAGARTYTNEHAHAQAQAQAQAPTEPAPSKAMSTPTYIAPLSSLSSHSNTGVTSSASARPATELINPKHHPLQHRWTLFFDSKILNPGSGGARAGADAAVGFATDSAPNLDAYAPPWLSKANDSGAGLSQAATTPKSASQSSSDSWEAALKILGAYRTVEAFMSVFSTIKRPSQLDKHSNYHLFKSGVKPMWEDPANANGGKWTLSFARGVTNPALLDRSWMWLVLALIGEELDADNDVTGAVVSTRPKADRISLWLRSRDDVEKVNKLGRKLVDLLEVEKEPGVSLEFSVNSGGTGGFHHSHKQSHVAGYWGFSNPPTLPTGPGAGGSGGNGGATGGLRPPIRSTGSSFSGASSSASGNFGAPVGRAMGGGGSLLGRSSQEQSRLVRNNR